MKLPIQYVEYLKGEGLKEGALRIDPGWFQLWPLDELKHWNQEYQVSEYAPGFLGFGSSGGGELLAFDSDGRVVMIPMIGMSADMARPVANSWSAFVELIEDVSF